MSLDLIALIFAVIAFVEGTVALIVLLAWKFSTHKVEYVTDTQQSKLRSSLGLSKSENGAQAPYDPEEQAKVIAQMEELFGTAGTQIDGI